MTGGVFPQLSSISSSNVVTYMLKVLFEHKGLSYTTFTLLFPPEMGDHLYLTHSEFWQRPNHPLASNKLTSLTHRPRPRSPSHYILPPYVNHHLSTPSGILSLTSQHYEQTPGANHMFHPSIPRPKLITQKRSSSNPLTSIKPSSKIPLLHPLGQTIPRQQRKLAHTTYACHQRSFDTNNTNKQETTMELAAKTDNQITTRISHHTHSSRDEINNHLTSTEQLHGDSEAIILSNAAARLLGQDFPHATVHGFVLKLLLVQTLSRGTSCHMFQI
eukprot:gene741-1420_t